MKTFFLFLLIMTPFLFSDELKRKELYYAYNNSIAGNIDKAYNLYHFLLEKSDESWLRDGLNYNLTTLLLMKSDYKKGLDSKSIFDGPLKEILTYYSQYNLALALIQFSKKEELEKGEKLLKEALKAAEESFKAYCQLRIKMGYANCPTDEKDSLQRAIAYQTMENKLLDQEKKRNPEDLKNALTWILKGISFIQQELEFLKLPELKEPLKSDYLNIYLIELNEQLTIWNKAQTFLKKEEDIKLFREGYLEFNLGIENLKQQAFVDSQSHFKNAYEIIRKLFNQQPPKRPKSQSHEIDLSTDVIEKNQKNDKINEVLKTVIEMENQDQSLQKAPLQKKVEKPW